MDKAVYIQTSAGWKNANDDLNIRGNYNSNNTIAGSPTVSTVPKVYAYTDAGWDQIYPAKEHKYGKITIRKPLNFYRWIPGLSKSNSLYGWRNSGKASQGYYGIDYYDDHINDDMTNVQRRNIGWLGLGSSARNILPNASSVKKITYLRFNITRGYGSGHYGELCPLSIGLNKIDSVVQNKDDANNPHLHNVGDSVVICNLKRASNTKTSDTEAIIDLSTSKGKEIANMVMKWMKGEDGVNSIVCKNEETSGKYFPGVGYWSTHYTTVARFSMTIEYIAEA